MTNFEKETLCKLLIMYAGELKEKGEKLNYEGCYETIIHENQGFINAMNRGEKKEVLENLLRQCAKIFDMTASDTYKNIFEY